MTTLDTNSDAGSPPVSAPRGESGAGIAGEIVEAVPHGIALLDLDGLVLEVNPATERLLGYGRADIIGKPCQPFTHPDDHKAEAPLLAAVLDGASEGYTIEKRYLRRNGEPVWARLDLRLVRDGRGEPLHVLALIEDVTERRRLDEEQRLLAEQGTILECITDGFVALDTNWRYTYVNKQAGELFGREPKDLLGTHIWEEFPDGVGQPFYEAYQRAMAQQTTIFLEDYYQPWDRWFENRIYGSRTGIAIYFTDITERKRVEEAERRQHERAEALRVANDSLTRTLDLEEVLGVLLDSLVRFVPYTSASVFLLTDDSQLAVGALRGHEELAGADVTQSLRKLRSHALVRSILEEGRTVVVEDSERDPDRVPLLAGAQVRSWIGVPLRAAGQVIGLCSVESSKPDAFPREDADWAEALTAQAAAAIENAHLHKQLQRHAIELEQRVGELAEAQRVAHIGSFEWDIAANRVSWSDELYRIYGLDPAEFGATFETFVEQLHPDDREEVVATIQRALAEGQPWRTDERIVRPSGEIRRLSTWGEVVRDEQGRPARLVGICHDVTDQRRQRERAEALRAANHALTRTLDLDEVLGVLLDSLARFVPYTSASVLLSGDDAQLTVGALRGYELLELDITQRMLELRGHRLVRRVLEEGQTIVVKDSEREPEGEPLLGDVQVRSWIAVPLRAGGQVIGLCSLENAQADAFGGEDVDWAEALTAQAAAAIENARLHDQLQRHAAELEQRVAARTRDLRAAMEEAERANRAKSEFIAGISHELRTPMNAILGFAQLLELDGLNGEQADGVQQILRAGRHLLELITELLDIARIEAGELGLSLERVNVKELLVDAVDLTRPLAETTGVTITINGDLGGYLLADRQRVLQVLLNLLANALKYNRQGGSVEVTPSRKGDTRVEIAVQDTGPGIASENLERLFLPFERLGLEGGPIEGAGLGLALTQRLIEAMGGRIAVTSTTGVGSTFTIELPRAEDPLAETDPAEQPVRQARAATILYIEDNLANLQLVERALTRQPGFNVLTATQGRLGLVLARDRQPDLILLDLHLPDTTGEEVLEELTSTPETAAIPVIVVSAAASKGRVQRLRQRGAHHYLTKPIDLAELLEVVSNAVGTRRALSDASRQPPN
jgi:PAS domain S-box-containing protein